MGMGQLGSRQVDFEKVDFEKIDSRQADPGRMAVWPVQDAKARFSELLETCVREGPQVVSRRGAELAVLVPIGEWRRLQASARPSLKQLLLAPEGRSDALVPPRGAARRRQPLAL